MTGIDLAILTPFDGHGLWRKVLLRSTAPLFTLCSGAAVGWVAWHPQGPVALIVLLPLLWTLQPSRSIAGLVWLGYFLAGSRDMPSVVVRFFPDQPWAFGIVLWLLDALILAIPWVLLWPKDGTPPPAVFLRTLIAIVVFTVPPIGLLGWLSPLLAGGVLYPGWGWIGIACVVAVLGLFAVVGHVLRAGRVTGTHAYLVLIAGLFASAAGANIAFRPPPAPQGWVAIDTQFGRFQTDRHAAFQRQQDLIRIAAEAIEGGATVVVLPEEVAGTWRTAVAYWWQPIDELAARHGATVLVGADVPVSTQSFDAVSPRFTDSMMMLGVTRGRVDARVPIPVGSWQPWARRGAVADIAGRGIVELHGVMAAVVVCYEELLTWPLLLSTAHEPQPHVLISAANNWFHEGQRARWVQRRSSELGARLFGVPLLRAINTIA